MVGVEEKFVVTAWRDAEELFGLRRDLYGDDLAARGRGVRMVQAWKLRKTELPLLLESTADLVDAEIQDQRGVLEASSLKLIFGGAIARFITGFADTSLELRRSKPSFHASNPSTPFLSLPPHLLEVRHSIVHREYPTLPTLRRSCRECLAWLWEWYWSRLDIAFSSPLTLKTTNETVATGSLTETELRTSISTLLKTYTKSRKTEIKSRRKGSSLAAKNAADALKTVIAMASSTPTTSSPVFDTLLMQLVDEDAVIPAGKALGTSMSGAFLLWSQLLVAVSVMHGGFVTLLVARMVKRMNAACSASPAAVEKNPVGEAFAEWLVHVLTSEEWGDVRRRYGKEQHGWKLRGFEEEVMESLFLEPGYWNLRVVERVIGAGAVGDGGSWKAILEAARGEGEGMDVDEKVDVGGGEGERETVDGVVEKTKGPQKWIGLWKPTPIGVLPLGWEDDE
ncbi:Las1-domain-containing protein [Aaosphaeria arxii CBS 175.79]|uniref:Las1-domain-containing protein n=1 Tax=Aaosphaeria arxii CBS 175.79 TaxID=1450172 RepID=A0A6A5XDR8_9PLEO|nr:Las1-domain-containing protein [Aaosphaeria arxii CBS 175.79]KAF2011295.1 Las1-domain-containing protein [Aaosphaeria arxii CBS 175.79]